MKRYVFLGLLAFSYTLQAAVFNLHKGLTTSKTWLGDVARVTECVVRNEQFLTEVGNFPKYTHTDKTPKQVEQALRAALVPGKEISVHLTTYKTRWPWSKTIAYRNVGDNTVYFNLWQNPREISEMLDTATHEWLHVVGFGHGNNSSRGKQDSVPYRVGSIAAKYIQHCK
jgi:hypothetical protein